MEEFDPNRDDPRTKVILLDTNKIFMKRTDPYGFIELSLERGSLPDWLKNQKFTTWESCRAAVDGYLEERGKVEVPENLHKVPIPVLQRKKVS
jgi:hypothetical protein